MFPVDGREIVVQKLMHASVRQPYRSLHRINSFQHAAVLHVKIRMLLGQDTLQLKLDHGDGLVHLPAQFLLQCIVIGRISMHLKNLAGIIPVHLHGKRSQRHHIDSVSILQNVQIAVADAVSDHRCHAGSLSHSGSHPHHVMVSPLDVKGMVIHQAIHDKVRARSSVINIPKHMKMIHNQSLDQLCKGNDEILRSSNVNNGIHNGVVISFLVQNLCLLRDQFLDHIGVISRQGLAYLGSGIFGGSRLAQLDQTVQGDLVPVLHVRLFFLHIGNLFLGIVHKSCQGTFVTVA